MVFIPNLNTGSGPLGPIEFTGLPSAAGSTGPIGATGCKGYYNPKTKKCIVGPTGPSSAKPAFTTSGSITLGDSNELFVKLAYTLPFSLSAADTFITSLVSRNFINNFEPGYFQIPYTYSACDNIINGNYTSSVTTIDSKIITTYIVPYKSEFIEKNVTFKTYFDLITNILFYEIPREFSYNSKDQGSIAVTASGTDFIGKISIPSTFFTVEENISYTKLLNFTINSEAVPSVLSGLGGNATMSVEESEEFLICCDCCGVSRDNNCFPYRFPSVNLEQFKNFCLENNCSEEECGE
jgi:hypothetical protein